MQRVLAAISPQPAAPPREAYIAPQINQMSRQELNETECGICFEELYVPVNEIRGPPVEITICHHRFHRNCLQQACVNNLINCSCPTCRTRFNFNANLEDLSPLVADRLVALDAEEAAAAQALVAGLNPQLLNYLQSNYAFDRISKEFNNCFSQIIDDAVAFRNDNNMGVELMRVLDGNNNPVPIGVFRNEIRGNPSQINNQKIEILENCIRLINKITQGYKYNPVYAAELLNSLENINATNARLQTAAFVESLYQPDSARNGMSFDSNAGLKFSSGSGPAMYNLKYLLHSGFVGRYEPNFEGFSKFINQLFIEMVGVFLTNNFISVVGDPREHNYLNLIPLTITRIQGGPSSGPIIKPDYRFFIRFFNCFVNFIRQLVAIDFNVGLQLGGKKTKQNVSKKRRKGRKGRKRKTKKN